MSQVIETMQVKKLTGEGEKITINKSDFNPDLHKEIKGEVPRKMLAADATAIGAGEGNLDSAAIKELGPRKTKAEKDAVDNAKVVKELGTVDPKGAAVGIGRHAPVEAKKHRPDEEADAATKEELGGASAGLSPVGGGVTANPNKTGNEKEVK